MGAKHGKPLGEILPGVLKNLGITERIEEESLFGSWREIVGDAVARRSAPRRINKGILIVGVENNAWMQEIRFHRKEILARIKERFPGVPIKGIRLELEREREAE
jgi:predicted nucleic acid-binding Zn ribbon protein